MGISRYAHNTGAFPVAFVFGCGVGALLAADATIEASHRHIPVAGAVKRLFQVVGGSQCLLGRVSAVGVNAILFQKGLAAGWGELIDAAPAL